MNILHNSHKLCEKCSLTHSNTLHNWCIPCEIRQEKDWTSSGNEKIDNFIQRRQLSIKRGFNPIFEWIPYDQLINIKEIKNYSFATIYSAKWKDGPLYWDKDNGKYSKKLGVEVILKRLHNLENNIDQFLNETERCFVHSRGNDFYINGISQNPDTNDCFMIFDNDKYFLINCVSCDKIYSDLDSELCYSCLIKELKQNVINWSGNEKIDVFIQERLPRSEFDPVFEWISYDQFNEIKEINKNDCFAFYSAEWKDGPLYLNVVNKEYLREGLSTKVILKYLHGSQNVVDQFLTEVKQCLAYFDESPFNYEGECYDEMLYGISQNQDTKNYFMVFNNQYFDAHCRICQHKYTAGITKWCNQCRINCLKINWTSKNEKINKFIQEIQEKQVEFPYGSLFEWISYDQFSEVKEMNKNDLATVYSAKWKDGPLYWDDPNEKYSRNLSTKVILKCLHNSQDNIDQFLKEVEKHPLVNYVDEFKLCGLSQKPDTNDYLMIFNNKYFDKYCMICDNKYSEYWTKWCSLCQIKELKENLTNWSGNKEIDEIIQGMQLKISSSYDIVFEWIPFNQFKDIKEINKDKMYSAMWENGSLCWDYLKKKYIRQPSKKVALIYLRDTQNIIDEFLNEIKQYTNDSKESYSKIGIHGISQDKSTDCYLIVLNDEYFEKYCEMCGEKYPDRSFGWCKSCQIIKDLEKKIKDWTSGNEELDNLIREMQLKVNSNDDIIFEWVPYNQFDNIEEIDKGGFATVYFAQWKNGPLSFVLYNTKNYVRQQPNMTVALKRLHDSQNITDKFLNEVKEYSIKQYNNILKIYGISQFPNTGEYIIILEYAKGGNFNKWMNNNYKVFTWTIKINILYNICNGLKHIHQKQIVHRDLHTGNILFFANSINFDDRNILSISDMGLCGQIATGKQPFANHVHDNLLALDICKGNRPEINEPEAPKWYVELMKKCWDSNPNNRPNFIEIFDRFYKINCILNQNQPRSYVLEYFNMIANYKIAKMDKKEITKIDENEDIIEQIMRAEEYRMANFKNNQLITYKQKSYTSKLLNPFTKDLPEYDSKSLSCQI
ncbi:kinase-like domain-containing protein [Rhizophagus clarus]|uniref:Kinase-like domain-containing protein n=1 Tax=Rhizophagus clarus TaxID=94130 RepID=A0A8H3LTG5_9GLOM|nr:kinase-like domain-containing protein [Rhizophagus clarus]